MYLNCQKELEACLVFIFIFHVDVDMTEPLWWSSRSKVVERDSTLWCCTPVASASPTGPSVCLLSSDTEDTPQGPVFFTLKHARKNLIYAMSYQHLITLLCNSLTQISSNQEVGGQTKTDKTNRITMTPLKRDRNTIISENICEVKWHLT